MKPGQGLVAFHPFSITRLARGAVDTMLTVPPSFLFFRGRACSQPCNGANLLRGLVTNPKSGASANFATLASLSICRHENDYFTIGKSILRGVGRPGTRTRRAPKGGPSLGV